MDGSGQGNPQRNLADAMRSFSMASRLLHGSKKARLVVVHQCSRRKSSPAKSKTRDLAESGNSESQPISSPLSTKQADLAFLQQANEVPARNAALKVSGSHSAAHIRTPLGTEATPDGRGIAHHPGTDTTKAMKLLMNAVKQHNFSYAEQLFAAYPRLSERPGAMRLLVKLYCEQLDFTSGKAVLLASLDKVGEIGVARFMAHVTFQSQRAEDIEEVLKRSALHFGDISPMLAATALYGLRFLNCASYESCWQFVSQYWEPSLHPATLRAKALDALLRENWVQAARLWKIAQGISHSVDAGPEHRIWYMALRYFLAEYPNLSSVDNVLSLMSEAKIALKPAFTEMLLRYLAPMFPEMTASAWLRYASQRGWPISAAASQVAIYWSQGGIRRFGKLSDEMLAYAHKGLHDFGGARHTGALHLREPALKANEHPQSASSVLNILRTQLKRGRRLPYAEFVAAFEQLTKLKARSELHDLVDLIRAHDYPLHCAGIDLSMVELHCRESNFDNETTKRLLSEYLTQYPLVSHDLAQLTRIAVLLTDSGAHSEAIQVVDGLRQSMEDPGGQFTAAVHDSASLQVMAQAKFRLQEPLAPFVRGIVADSPDIYFDRTLRRKLSRMLVLHNEDLGVLRALDASNEQTIARCYKEIDTVVDLTAQAHA